jgi:hypothetical protein
VTEQQLLLLELARNSHLTEENTYVVYCNLNAIRPSVNSSTASVHRNRAGEIDCVTKDRILPLSKRRKLLAQQDNVTSQKTRACSSTAVQTSTLHSNAFTAEKVCKLRTPWRSQKTHQRGNYFQNVIFSRHTPNLPSAPQENRLPCSDF